MPYDFFLSWHNLRNIIFVLTKNASHDANT